MAKCLFLAAVCAVWPGAVLAQALPEMGWLGISISEVNEDLAERLGFYFGF